jgi:inner membrane transporter RhtA
MMISSSIAVQTGSALSLSAFAALGVFQTAGLRFLVAGALLLLIVRPSIFGRSRADWAWILGLSVTAVVMNLSFYEAIHRLPLGTAVTIEFLGPLTVAVVASRRPLDVGCAVLAAVGVFLLAGPSFSSSPVGISFAAVAAVAEAGYLLLSNRVALRTPGFDGLALSVGAAALITLPLSVTAAGNLDATVGLRVALSGALGIALAYFLEMQALRHSGPRAVGIFFSLDPAVATVVGLVFIDQTLSAAAIGGLFAVVSAGCITSATRPPVP